MKKSPGYLIFGALVALAYGVASLSGFEPSGSMARGPQGTQGLNSYRGGK